MKVDIAGSLCVAAIKKIQKVFLNITKCVEKKILFVDEIKIPVSCVSILTKANKDMFLMSEVILNISK